VDYSDGARVIRQRNDRLGTAIDRGLFGLAKEALYLAWRRRVRIRKLKLICDRLVPPPRQLELFPEEDNQNRKSNSLQTALDRIRDSYGTSAIRTGRTLAA
jgi:DNA polymerase-4